MKKLFIASILASVSMLTYAEVVEIGTPTGKFPTLTKKEEGTTFKETLANVLPKEWSAKLDKNIVLLNNDISVRSYETWIGYIQRLSLLNNFPVVVDWDKKLIEIKAHDPISTKQALFASSNVVLQETKTPNSTPLAKSPLVPKISQPVVMPTMQTNMPPVVYTLQQPPLVQSTPKVPVANGELNNRIAQANLVRNTYQNQPNYPTQQPPQVSTGAVSPTQLPQPLPMAQPYVMPQPSMLEQVAIKDAQESYWTFELDDLYLSRSLKKWADQAKLGFEWQATKDYILNEKKEFRGSISKVVSDIDSALREVNIPFGAKIENGKIIVFDRTYLK